MLDLNKLVVPENTKFEEGSVVSEGDIIICPGSSISYGLIGKTIVIGEKVKVEGDIVGEEVRIDTWCNIKGNVVSKGEAYVGEFTVIDGKLTVFGDLDIGRNVKVKEGFEARGLITIQDPLPVIVFIFFYLLELLRLGKLEEAEQIFEDVEEFEKPLIIPNNTIINLNQIKTESDTLIEKSRVLGNIKAKNVEVNESEVFGSVRGKRIIIRGSKIHGAVEGNLVLILRDSEVIGHIKAGKVYVEENCTVEGTIIGKAGVIIKPKINVNKILENIKEEEITKESKKEEIVEGLNKPKIDEESIKVAIKNIKAIKSQENQFAIESGFGKKSVKQEFGYGLKEDKDTKKKFVRNDPFKFEKPDKIPSVKDKIESVNAVNDISKAVDILKSIKDKDKNKEK